MIGIKDNGSNLSISNESYRSDDALVDEQPRKMPSAPPYTAFANGRNITVVEPQSHWGTYKKAYIVWGVGTAIGFVASLSCGIPLCASIAGEAGPQIGSGVSAGVTACGSVLASLTAVRVAHKINQEKGLDTTVTGGIIDFSNDAKSVMQKASKVVEEIKPI